ncbi:hypothetical protein [Modestobacter sp. VKM Ac-2985]|uniref:hypothetical protein n=1 Tax=Modestobacter sp. VKM Ac-2985 TaxID=3004139 RepID=UPI0022AB74D8|nr:hypothetical protein [Modestobacter sp. VKM Ac-2985]MCZ2837139.1 hypothetical protein [Modestobacter sp. VKM Ac-2985]
MTAPVYSAPLDLVTTAVVELIRSTGRDTYDGEYTGSPARPAYPYFLLYRIPGGSSDVTPDMDGDARTVTVAYQLTTVSNRRNQCEAAARVGRDRLLGRDGAGWVYGLSMPAGWLCIDRSADRTMAGIDRSGTAPSAVFSLPSRYYLTITPA